MLSREDSTTTASDVFSRLGAGEKDPAPGGNIQRTNGKVSFLFFYYSFFLVLFYKILNANGETVLF